jgi:hypothetical protein
MFKHIFSLPFLSTFNHPSRRSSAILLRNINHHNCGLYEYTRFNQSWILVGLFGDDCSWDCNVYVSILEATFPSLNWTYEKAHRGFFKHWITFTLAAAFSIFGSICLFLGAIILTVAVSKSRAINNYQVRSPTPLRTLSLSPGSPSTDSILMT